MPLPRITPGLVEASRAMAPKPDRWHGPFTWRTWLMDWCDFAGGRLEVTAPGARPVTVERPVNTWCVFAPGVAYRHIAPPGPTRVGQRWLFFELDAPFAPLAARAFTVVSDPEERIAAQVDAMYQIQQHREPGGDIAAQGHALVVMGELAMASRRGHAGAADDPWPVRAPVAARTTGDGLLQRVERAVLRSLARPPALADLAATVDLSPSALSHRFQRETGMSVMARVRWLRIREARRLLSEPDATVAAVARAVGFSSPFHLSRVFRQVTGMSPGEFRRRSRAAPAARDHGN
ncbi:MAG TPA: AraC family transcriptional regulator [Planctomycetota bacterium]|nr:AraC family transcriptional regulator [Planctomycetota bacterium]